MTSREKYDQSEKGRERHHRYNDSQKGAERQWRYEESDKGMRTRYNYECMNWGEGQRNRSRARAVKRDPDYPWYGTREEQQKFLETDPDTVRFRNFVAELGFRF